MDRLNAMQSRSERELPTNGFVNLHNHSDYSILDGYSHPEEYIKRAAELGQTAVGLTDHGNLFGAFSFIKAARALSKTTDRKNHPQKPIFVKPIIGIEAYMAPQNPEGARCKKPVFYSPELNEIIERRKALGYNTSAKVAKLNGEELRLFRSMESRERELRAMDVSSRGAYTHLTLIAINDEGFHNLIHLTTEANKRENNYQHGRMDFDMLTKWNEGIIATTGCPSGEIQTRLRLGQVDEAYEYARRMSELFKGRYYVELMLHNMNSDLESSMLPKLRKLADDLNLPLLATNDSHYARPEDAIHHEEMLCVQTNSRNSAGSMFVTMDCLKTDDPSPDRMVPVKQPDGTFRQVKQPRRFAFQGDDYYLKTYDEMIKAFPEDEYPGAVSNTVRIADMVGDWWVKPSDLEIETLEHEYHEGFAGDDGSSITLPHATGGRTNRVVKANKGVTALGETPDPTDVPGGFDMDPLTQRLIDDGKVFIGPYDLSLNTDLRPEVEIPNGWTEEEWFKKKINEGFLQRRVALGDSNEILEDSKRRIADEFPVFAGKNFIQYMLVVQNYITWAREHGVSVGEGRGSVGGSEIAYLMDISRTDPVRHDLLFERFLNPERNSPPDVDTDFKASVRNDVLQYAKDRYGYDKVANIITFTTFQFKQSFRDIAKIHGMTNDEVNRISKLIPEPIEHVSPTMHDLYDKQSQFYDAAADFREVIASNPKWAPIIDSTDKITGRVRGTGTHACGVIMSSKSLSDYAPLYWEKDERKAKENIWTDCMVGWEYPDLESLGLIKMDFLPLKNLDIIDNAIANIESYNTSIEQSASKMEADGEPPEAVSKERSRELVVPRLDNIESHSNLDDTETFKMLSRGDSDAVFQLGSDGQKALLKRIKPDCFEDIVAINALYRPGPMGMNAHLEYADRKNGRLPSYVINKTLDKAFKGTPVETILKPTYGLCIYQESIMQISRLLCGFTRGQADSLRKAMGHKIPEEMEANHKRFIDGAMVYKEKNGWRYTREDVEALWSYIEEFSKYGFNRSHSVSYAINAYKTAYLKANYYPFFMASVMTQKLGDKEQFAVLLRNVEDNGLKVGPVNVNRSSKGIIAVVKDNADDYDIVFGFDKASGVNAELADRIATIRGERPDGRFISFDEFMMNVPEMGSTAISGLANAGAFDVFGLPRKAVARKSKDIATFYKKKRSVKHKTSNSLLSLFQSDDGGAFDPMGDFDFGLTGDRSVDEYSLHDKLKAEKDSLGVYVSVSPESNAGKGIDFLRNTPDYRRAVPVSQVEGVVTGNLEKMNENPEAKMFNRTSHRVIGWFSSLDYKRYRSGNGVFFMGSFADSTGSVDVSVNGELAERLAGAVGLRPVENNPLDGVFPMPTFYRNGELNTKRRTGTTVDEQVDRLTDVLLDVTIQVTNDRARVIEINPVHVTSDGKVPLIMRLSDETKVIGHESMGKLVEVFKRHPGDTPVWFDLNRIVNPGAHPVFEGVRLQAGPFNVMPFSVDMSDEMMEEVRPLTNKDDRFMSWADYRRLKQYDPAHQ